MHHDINDGIQLTMGPLGTLDGRYIIAIIRPCARPAATWTTATCPTSCP